MELTQAEQEFLKAKKRKYSKLFSLKTQSNTLAFYVSEPAANRGLKKWAEIFQSNELFLQIKYID